MFSTCNESDVPLYAFQAQKENEVIDTKELRRLAQAATPGPWQFWHGWVAVNIDSDGGTIIVERPTPSGGKYQARVDGNFRFIAAANPAAINELLDRLKVAEKERAERDELLAALQRIADGQEMSGVFTFADVVLRYQEIARTAIALPGAQPAPSEKDEPSRKAWARFSNALHRSPDAPYPGMSEAFEKHFSQSFTDREWRAESGVWAAAWKAAKNHGAQPAPSVPKKIKRVESGFKGMFLREAQAYKQGWNECRAAMLAVAPEAKP